MKVIEIRKVMLAGVVVLGLCGLAAGGSALEFDGVDDYVQVSTSPSLEPDEITVTAWVFLSGEQTRNTRVVRKAGHFQSGFLLAADQDNDRLMQFRVDNTTTGLVEAADTQTHLSYIGKWHHFAGVYSTGYVALYVDGAERSRVNHTKGNMLHTDNLYIGTGVYDSSEFFNGLIDELAIYGRALGASEIEDIYHCGVAADSNLVGYWGFEEGAGQVAYDGSAYGNDGYLGSDPNGADSSDPVWVASEVPGVTYHVDVVDGDNGNDGLTKETAFATIQMGIDSAEDCDTVKVWPGVYNESLFFINKGITVQSAADAAELVASGIYAASLYTSEGPESVLKNFVIRDSDTGVYVSSGAPWLEHLTIVNCDLGVEAEAGAEPNIVNSILWNNYLADLFQCEAEYSWVEEEMEPNLVAYWRFDEGSGTTAYDWTGNNDGTINGAMWTTGKVGGALEFDGSNDYVELPDNNPIWLPEYDFSLSAWVYCETIPEPEEFPAAILDLEFANSGGLSGSTGCGILVNKGSGEIILRMTTATNIDDDLFSNTGLFTGSWYHIVAVRNATTQAIYIDGQLDNSRTCTGDAIKYVGDYGDDNVQIGRATKAGFDGQYFDGRIDEVGIWDRALSAGEVEQLYENGLAGHEYIDPVFADANGGDYHLKSERGRYWPEHDVWVLDEVSSPCIDAGDASVEPSGEPAANGGRINMGAYGNTAYASMSEWGLRGDFDYDGAVGLDDVGSFTDEWLEAVSYSQEPSGSALEFDGVDDYVSVPDSPSLDITGEISLMCWTKLLSRDTSDVQISFGKRGAYVIYPENHIYGGTGNWKGQITGTQGDLFGTTNLEAGQWYHLSMTYDGTIMRVYLNGQSEGERPFAGGIGTSDYNLSFGDEESTMSYPLHGTIDEAAIYDRALSASEIEDIYHCGVFADVNLVGYWGFEEGEGLTAYDSSGNDNDGALIGGPVWVESGVAGVTYHVDGAGGDNDNDGLTQETAFETIQFGIDTAEGCDTVVVWPGVYNESLFFINKGITVRSVADAAEITATGLYAGSFYNFGGGDATLGNFVITDSDTGIYVGSGQPELTNLTVVGNWLGVEAEAAAEPDISNCIFWGNDYDLFQCTANYSLIEEEIEPVAYWKFDGDANDSVGGNVGIIYGNPVWTTGQINSALSFDGVDDYVDCDNTFASVTGSTTKSIMAWAKSDTASYPGDSARIFSLYRGSGNSGFVITAQGNPITWQGFYRKAGGISQWLDSGVYVAVDEWTHIALVQDGANINLYINGVSEISASDGIAPTISNPSKANIGCYWNGYDSFFDGSIDEVGIWDRALSAAEVERLYEDGLAGRGLALEPLFADANAADYHLLSERGRYWPAEDVWVLDDVTSPGVDGGDVSVDPSDEPMPNGARVNMGAYGGTAYASMSEWPIAGDMDEDGIVNMVDYGILADEWLEKEEWLNEAPQVYITDPPDGYEFYWLLETVWITADAWDSDGSVVKVDFFANGAKIGQDSDGSDGWQIALSFDVGTYVLTAKATDDDGATDMSPPVTITATE